MEDVFKGVPREGQRKVIEAYLDGKDLFVCSPTCLGKSLCFEIAPFLFEAICVGVDVAETQSTASSSSVWLVVAPLVSLIKDQVSSLRNQGIAGAMIDRPRIESSAAEMKDIHDGRINLVFGSSEALLNSHKTVF